MTNNSESNLGHLDHNDPETLIEESLKVLKDKGFKMTKKRREILEIFAEDQRYHSAKHIHSTLAEKYPTMSYNTTYRNLYDFVENGLLESTEYNQEQMFRIACDSDHHHHHFICTSCGMTIALDVCPMDLVGDRLDDVQVESHRFEVFGLCKDCQMA